MADDDSAEVAATGRSLAAAFAGAAGMADISQRLSKQIAATFSPTIGHVVVPQLLSEKTRASLDRMQASMAQSARTTEAMKAVSAYIDAQPRRPLLDSALLETDHLRSLAAPERPEVGLLEQLVDAQHTLVEVQRTQGEVLVRLHGQQVAADAATAAAGVATARRERAALVAALGAIVVAAIVAQGDLTVEQAGYLVAGAMGVAGAAWWDWRPVRRLWHRLRARS
jgi:hypothetical protein